MRRNLIDLYKKKKFKPYIIAEIGNNHNGDFNKAKKLIYEAKRSGADCVKFQTFSSNSLFSKNFLKKNKALKKQSDKFTLKLNQFQYLKNYADKIKINFIATPFSFKEVDYLIDKLKLKLLKIASMDLNNYPLIQYIAKKKVSVILSTGFGTKAEICKAVSILKKNKIKFFLLHCISEYPPNFKKLNLNRINHLKEFFSVPIGFSDHTIGTDASISALTLGANIIEKHFTLNKNLKGWDHSISASPNELKTICDFSKKIPEILGKKNIYRVEAKKNLIQFRRSIVAARNIKAGERIKISDLNYKRPGDGLDPIFYKKIIGKKLKKFLNADQKILLENLKN